MMLIQNLKFGNNFWKYDVNIKDSQSDFEGTAADGIMTIRVT